MQMLKMLKRSSPLATHNTSYDDEKSWSPITLESEKVSSPAESVVDIDLNDSVALSNLISTSLDSSKADPSLSTASHHHHHVRQEGSDSPHLFTFRCRPPRSFPATLITPQVPADPLLSCATTTTTTTSKSTVSVPVQVSVPCPVQCTVSGAGPSVNEIQDSLTACSIEPPTRESYATLSKRRFGFDTSLANVQYGYATSKPYRFTSPLSPDPKIRKRSKHRRYKPKSAPASLLQKTLRRNHADALRKRYPLRSTFSSPPCYDFLPSLDEADDDDDDEFDDDEDDEIIDDYDIDGDAQVDDIVDLYNQSSPEQDVDLYSKYNNCKQTAGPESAVHAADVTIAAEGLIHISSTMMTDPTSPRLEPVSLKPVLEETGAFVYVAHESDF